MMMKILAILILVAAAAWAQMWPSPGPGVAGSAGVTADANLFSGTGQYLSRSGDSLLSASNGPFTIALWVKPANLTQTDIYLFEIKLTTSGQTSIIWEYVNNQVEFFSGYTGTNPRTDSGITLSDTNWHHIAYRKDASGSSNWDKFLDGTKTSINASIDFTFIEADATDAIYVATSTGGSNLLNGAIAQVIVASASLSDAEISGLHSGCTDPTTLGLGANLLAWWKLQGASPEPDSSGNSLSLTVAGSPSTTTGPSPCT